MTSAPSEIAVAFDEKKIDAIFAGLDQCHLPGAAVGIAVGGKPVYRKGFGLASMGLPVALSPSIRMRIGSVTKHFTCLAYMLLCEDGKAGIDDPVGKHLPDLHAGIRNITMRHLMGNTGGLRDVYDIFTQFNDNYSHGNGAAQSATVADLLSLYRDIDDVNADPGTAWSYNNGGWLILSIAIERIAGQPLEQVMRDRVFEPIGMYDTLLRRSDRDFMPNSATQHATSLAGGYERLYWGLDNFLGAGAMASTVDDMLRWLAHMDAPKVGRPATWAAMKSPQRLANGTCTGYGFGLKIGRYRGIDTLSHGGNALGGNAQMLKVPAACLDVVVIVNRQDLWSLVLGNSILDACLPELDPVQAPASFPIATGTFRSPTSGRVIQLFVRDGRQVVSMGGLDFPAVRDEDGVLRPAGLMNHVKHALSLVGEESRPSSIQFNDFGNVDELTREQRVEALASAVILGRYRSDTTDTDATISKSGSGVRLTTVGRFGSAAYELECLAKGIWRTRPARLAFIGGMLSFTDDAAEFSFSNFQTRPLRFRRCA